MDREKGETTGGSSGKVLRLIDTYDLHGIGDELVAKWTATEDRKSLRELAGYFNKELIRSKLNVKKTDTLPGEVDNLYNLLTNEEVTSGVRIQAENRIRDYGVDVEQLQSDFVSRQAIHTYLTSDRDADYSPTNTGNVLEGRLGHIQRLKSRLSAVARQTLTTSSKNDGLILGDFQVLVSVRIQCSNCGSQYSLSDLIDRGGCDCPT